MPIKCIEKTQASKLGPIAATYRAAEGSMYGTCPSTCSLLPQKEHGTKEIDYEYLNALIASVPSNGVAWTYSHFHHTHLPKPIPNTTVINASTDTVDDACTAANAGYPTVYAAPHDDKEWPRTVNGRRFVRCPADEHKKITCHSCGGGKPLCARGDRDYVIVFVAHGSQKKKVGTGKGGCYASQGRCTMHWQKTAQSNGTHIIDDKNPEQLIHWAKSLPPGTLLRHAIAGDLGKPTTRKVIPISLAS